METQRSHGWQFFRAGNFDQVRINSVNDLVNLRYLDQKLWATLACPTANLALDHRMLNYIDTNADGRIRAPELLDAVDWVLERLADGNRLFTKAPLTLTDFKDNELGERLASSARRLLGILGRDEFGALTPDDTSELSAFFPANQPNGDGLVPAALTQDMALQEAIGEIIAALGAETDRSGEPAVSAALIETFSTQIKALYDWQQQAATVSALSAAGMEAISAVRDKVQDYFTRVELAAYDGQAATLIQQDEAELIRQAANPNGDAMDLALLPLASVQHGNALPLTSGVNPAWKEALAQLREHAVLPLLGDIDQLTSEQWQQLLAQGKELFAWQASKPDSAITLSSERIAYWVEQDVSAQLMKLVDEDLQVKSSADGLVDLDKMLRLHQGLIRLLRNFVSFQDFYGREEKAVFQAGRLYIDGKSCDLVVEVGDVGAHSAVATHSNSFLMYCHCVRRGQPVRGQETMNIVAAMTAGAEHDLAVGRNGLFYDRDDNDWDATIVKVLENAISVREAFWSPYRRVVNMISAQIQKMAASRDEKIMADSSSKITEGTDAAKTFDIARFAGIFAAIGLALGAIGTALAAVMSGLLSLQWWQLPLVLLGVMLLISCPSMLMAWFKLRRRSLGPILDANGWAVNAQARISIPFGASLTHLASLPKGASRSLKDPYMKERSIGAWLVGVLIVLVIIAIAGWWYLRPEPVKPVSLWSKPAQEQVEEVKVPKSESSEVLPMQ